MVKIPEPMTAPMPSEVRLSIGAVIGSGIFTIVGTRSEEHTSELQSPCNLVCRLLLEKKKNKSRYQRTLSYSDTLKPVLVKTIHRDRTAFSLIGEESDHYMSISIGRTLRHVPTCLRAR